MMAQVNAGRVRFVGRGEYNNSTQYYVFDLVSYNGNSYYAKADTIRNLPTNTTYWQLVAEKGNVGPIGLTGNGISSITKTGTSGLVDTYTITFTNGNTTTFDVTNGKGIDRIEKTATVGNIDTYTIYFNDNSTSTFEVANGEVTREELEEEVDRLSMIYNLFPTTSDEDTEMTLDGTGEVKLKKIGLKGNTSQKTTTGKNLYNANQSYTFTSNSTTWFFIDGAVGAYGSNIGTKTELKAPVENGKTYTISFNLTGTVSGTQVVYEDETDINGFGTNTGDLSYTFTSNRNGYAILRTRIENGQSVTFKNVMLEQNNSKTSYEPYTGNQPSPNPDYPQDIQVVSGDNTIKVEGKNLFDKDSEDVGYVYSSTGSYSVSALWNTSDWISVESNSQYRLSFKTTGTSNLFFSEFDKNKKFIQRTTTGTLTPTSNTKYVRLSYKNDIGIYDIQLEKSSTATTYEPYVSQTYPINLGDIELCKIGDYQDKIAKSSGKNLFDKVDYSTIAISSNASPSNLTKTTNKISFTGNSSNDNCGFYIISSNVNNYIDSYNSETTYYISADITTNKNCTFRFGVSNTPTTELQSGTTRLNFSRTGSGSLVFYVNRSDANIEITNIMVSTLNNTSYEPYGKVWYLNKQIGKVVLDGSEDWEYRSTQDSFLHIMNTQQPSTNCFCNYFKSVTSQIGDNDKSILLGTSGIFIHYNDMNKTSSTFKTWLNTHNTDVYYVLATPTTTEITDTTLIEQLDNLENAYSYDTQTNITQTNDDMPFILDVEALMSLKGVLN